MKNCNLKYNKFKAISKYDIDDNIIKNTDRLTENFKNSIISKELSVGHLCCTLSHYEIYKKFSENHNEKYLLIFEDDALIVDNFTDILLDTLNFIENNNKAIDILLCGFFCNSENKGHSEMCN